MWGEEEVERGPVIGRRISKCMVQTEGRLEVASSEDLQSANL